MSLNQLVPCDGCTRHVRRTEAACPFCGLASPLASASSVTPEPPARLSRAGILAFVATVGAGACSSAQPVPTALFEAPTAQQTPAADSGAPATPVATPEPTPGPTPRRPTPPPRPPHRRAPTPGA
nr:hypothetical protein [Deltaproteobacteria bacterium]